MSKWRIANLLTAGRLLNNYLMKKPCYLTKSRFKLALDWPTKLYYTRKQEYENQSETDTFLQALAQGGFQVEELARMQYTEGIALIQ